MLTGVDADVRSLQDQLTGYLVGALHGLYGDAVEWHHDGRTFLPAFTVTNPATGASIVIHIDPAGQ